MMTRGGNGNYDRINIKLIKLWKEYKTNNKSNELMLIDEETAKIYESMAKTKKFEKYNEEVKTLLESNLEKIFPEHNKEYDYVMGEIFDVTYGIEGAFFKNYCINIRQR